MQTTKKKKRPTKLWDGLAFIVSLLLLLSFFTPYLYVIIPAGHKGVLFRTLGPGTETRFTCQEGWNFKLPWNDIVIYDTRKKIETREIEALSNDGLKITTNVSVRFRVNQDSVAILHKNVGQDYVNVSIIPEVESAIRQVISQYDPHSLYSVKRDSIEDFIKTQIRNEIQKIDVNVSDVLIKSIQLPDHIMESIEIKLVEEQRNLAYEYRLQREEQEAERKLIEAIGIRNFEDSSGISIVKWQGIEATKAIARSENSKVVIMGNDAKSLPVILNTD